jgi:hypothetical protein
MQVEAWSDSIIEIANSDKLEADDKRVRLDALKWLVSKIAPKNYGNRLLVAGDAASPVQVLHKQVSLEALSVGQLSALEQLASALLIEQR